MERFVRKDALPSETIERILSILNDCGIKINIVNEINYKSFWYSVRIEIQGLPQIGTNGKGISKEYALASALGEFMERLQTDQLIHPYYKLKMIESYKNKNENSQKEVIAVYRSYFKKYIGSNFNEKFSKMINLNPEMGILTSYYSVNNNNYIELPDAFIRYLCGSNGTCAGNTKEEAIAQGLNELLERFALRKIYFSKHTFDHFPSIAPTALKGFHSYELLNQISKKGYFYRIKDCSLNGKIPVIGLIVFNNTKTKYRFALGSDLNPDICIQRCITEMFQGRDFNIYFKMSMFNTIEPDIRGDNVTDLFDSELEFLKTMKDGSGQVPLGFLLNPMERQNFPKIFSVQKLDNKQNVEMLFKIFSNLKSKIYIRDCSYMGFPTYRIYSPGISEIIVEEQDLVSEIIEGMEVRKLFFDLSFTKNGIEEFISKYKHVIQKKRYAGGISVNSFMGYILENNKIKDQYLINSFILLFFLSMIVKDFRSAVDFYSLAQKNNKELLDKKKNDSIQLFLDFCMKNKPFSEIKKYLNFFISDKDFMNYITNIYNIKFEELELPKCPICSECRVKELCKFNIWEKIYIQLENKKFIN